MKHSCSYQKCFILATAIQQEENCIERESRDRPSSKLQSAIYYALDGDQVTILTMLAQRSEDPWVIFLFKLPSLIISSLEWYFSSPKTSSSCCM